MLNIPRGSNRNIALDKKNVRVNGNERRPSTRSPLERKKTLGTQKVYELSAMQAKHQQTDQSQEDTARDTSMQKDEGTKHNEVDLEFDQEFEEEQFTEDSEEEDVVDFMDTFSKMLDSKEKALAE